MGRKQQQQGKIEKEEDEFRLSDENQSE